MTTAVEPVSAAVRRETPSAFQRAAIEAPVGPLLVRAGPGAGKTFCLIERIRFLIERAGVAPERLCAFTFTNKAAGEIASRLRRTLGDRADAVKSGTIHAFCAELLREFGGRVGLPQGFGIADENYQCTVLRRLGCSPRYLKNMLVRFGAYRFRGEPLDSRDEPYFAKYEDFLAKRRVVDFDMLLLKTAELLTDAELLAQISSRWDCILIDEFQDLNPVQYAVIKALTRTHRHVVAVGDDEQSVYSWTGADPRVFLQFMNDFGVHPVDLHDNRRCPRQVVVAARRLVDINTPLLPGRPALEEGRDSRYPVVAVSFPTEEAELAWIIDDIRRDREETRVAWGEIALLYRTHRIGDAAEAAFISAGIPCRLAMGRAFADDPIVAYVIAALRVISSPDDVHHEGFLEVVLPRPLVDRARAQAPGGSRTFLEQLRWIADGLPREDGDGRRIRRGFSTLANLAALARRHLTLSTLVEELLSQRVGEYRTVLEEHHDELTDPSDHPEVVRLAERMDAAILASRAVWLPSMGGVEIPLRTLLLRLGVEAVTTGGTEPPPRAEAMVPADAIALGLPVTLFKAAQLLRSRGFDNAFRDFTAVDIETTDNDVGEAEIVDIAAVRVRDGRVVDEIQALVRPLRPISPRATEVHGLAAADVAGAELFAEVWPRFREFCGRDVIVAHNGYHFDFPIIRRMAAGLAGNDLCTYDTLPLARELHTGSAKLGDLAHHFGVPAGTAHRALDDTRALAAVFVALGDVKVARARKTSLANLLDHLGLALAIADEDWRGPEVARLRHLARPYTLGRYSDCLDTYAAAREAAGDPSLPSVETVIERLGGVHVMQRIRAEKTADARYPLAMARLRRLLEQSADGSLAEQIALFLERVALSRSDGVEPEPDRVNLLTLHSTKGLEFSRVYVVGAEDGQLPGSSATRQASKEEIEEARRLLYVGMTRTKDRLVLTRAEARGGDLTGGHQFLDEMGLTPATPS